jgi:tetratricopeptide (TPR) repeat protein
LEAAVSRDPKDVAAWEAIGRTYRAAGRLDDAMAAYQHALTHSPNREVALAEAANVAGEMEQPEAAMQLWRRAIAVNPWMGHYHAQLARSYARLSRWSEAQATCRKALELDPFDYDVRVLLVTSCIRVDARVQAEEEFKRLVAVHPSKESELRPWFEKQLKR